ncbi:MAG: hypothetical protein ACLUI3_11825 [Christensenellales bacterium]
MGVLPGTNGVRRDQLHATHRALKNRLREKKRWRSGLHCVYTSMFAAPGIPRAKLDNRAGGWHGCRARRAHSHLDDGLYLAAHTPRGKMLVLLNAARGHARHSIRRARGRRIMLVIGGRFRRMTDTS